MNLELLYKCTSDALRSHNFSFFRYVTLKTLNLFINWTVIKSIVSRRDNKN